MITWKVSGRNVEVAIHQYQSFGWASAIKKNQDALWKNGTSTHHALAPWVMVWLASEVTREHRVDEQFDIHGGGMDLNLSRVVNLYSSSQRH
jgi:hypothetical protein